MDQKIYESPHLSSMKTATKFRSFGGIINEYSISKFIESLLMTQCENSQPIFGFASITILSPSKASIVIDSKNGISGLSSSDIHVKLIELRTIKIYLRVFHIHINMETPTLCGGQKNYFHPGSRGSIIPSCSTRCTTWGYRSIWCYVSSGWS